MENLRSRSMLSAGGDIWIDPKSAADGVYAMYDNGKMLTLDNAIVEGSVGVAVIQRSLNMGFFIDKMFPTGSKSSISVGNYKALLNKTNANSYLTQIKGSDGDYSAHTIISEEARTNALTAWNSGKTGVSNTTLICSNDSRSGSINPAAYCRGVVNPITGIYDGYLGCLEEWIVINDNITKINQILNAIGGVAFESTNSGYKKTTDGITRYNTYYITSSIRVNITSNTWILDLDSRETYFAFFAETPDSNKTGTKYYCARPFFPLQLN